MSVVVEGLERARAFLAYIPRAAEKAVARALNRAATVGREEAIKSITDRYVVRAGDVREKITLRPATPDRLVMSIVARSGPLSLSYFPHSPTAIGTGGRGKPLLRAEVLRGQVKSIPGAFVAPINSKPRIMLRTGGRTASNRAAIKSLSTVPIANMLGAKTVQEAVEARAFAVFDEQLGREIDRELKRDS